MNKDEPITDPNKDFLRNLTGLINEPDSENSILLSNYDDFVISANSLPSIDWNWNSTMISPIPSLTTDQINSLNQITIQPITTYPYPTSHPTIHTLNSTGWKDLAPSNALDVKGDANFEGDIKIKGKSLTESLEKIEEKLAILRPNEELETKWEKLRELRRQYIECEKDIIEKEKIWETLKK